MRRAPVVMAVMAMLIGAGCGGGGGVSAGSFVDKIDDVCRTLDRDLGDLTKPESTADVADYAGDASKAFEDALSDLKKLAVPSGNSDVVSDAKSLVSNLDDQIDLLDDIASAAGSGDQATVDSKIADFEALLADDADLGDSLGADRCALDPLFSDIAPPVTDPPVTDPPITDPPITDPPVTDPPITDPPVDTTDTGSNKTYTTLASAVTPNGGFTFVDVESALVDTFTILLDLAPQTSVQPGRVAAIEVYDGGSAPITRIFVYLPDTPLPHSAVDEVATLLAGSDPLTPVTLGGLAGAVYTPADGGVFFVAANDPVTTGFMMWAVATEQATLDVTIAAFLAGLG